jgi:uncharacterized cupin superfamily protein
MPNIFKDEFTGRLDLSSSDTAMYVYDVEPGDSFPYHYEYVEEWLLVVDGEVVVRVPDGERPGLTAASSCAFPQAQTARTRS